MAADMYQDRENKMKRNEVISQVFTVKIVAGQEKMVVVQQNGYFRKNQISIACRWSNHKFVDNLLPHQKNK